MIKSLYIYYPKYNVLQKKKLLSLTETIFAKTENNRNFHSLSMNYKNSKTINSKNNQCPLGVGGGGD